ncbi:rRNA methyltransferase 1, mitochondrial [Patagioenas fasciata]|uniref:rRNA methyltransferase 1, mitochondrial n=1 Tax=Patagioenas fasciata TaxID=372321 RepID=UPI0032E92204
MEPALRAGVRRAVGLSPVLPRCWRGLRFRSTREERPPPFAAAGGDGEGPPRGGDGGRLSPPALPGGSRLNASRGDPAPQSRPFPWHPPRSHPGNPRASGASKRLERKPPPVVRPEGSELLFGVAPCALALARARRGLFRLFLQPSSGSRRAVTAELALQAAARGVPVQRVRRRELDALCRGHVHQGVCLEATPLRFKSLEEAEKPDVGGEERAKPRPVWLVLEHIQDPMNLGALLRSAYFLGVDRVVTSQRNSCPLTPTVSKASSGVMEVFDVYSTDDLRSFLKAKSAEGWEVVGTVSKPEDVEDVPVISCLEFRWNKPVILVIGSEGDGLSLETQLLCHRMLTIPPGRALHPGIESLNVSVATGILLHSICSQKLRHGG